MINTIILVAIIIMTVAMILAMIRFIIGPNLVNRVVAFDSLTIISLAMIAIIATLADRMIYLDVAIVYGLLSFMGVIVVAKYIQRGL